jgi:hypothetical protein
MMTRFARLAGIVTTLVLVTAACGGGSPGGGASPGAGSGASSDAGAQTSVPSQPAVTGGGGSGGPSWWPSDLAMPSGVTLVGDQKGVALWTGGDPTVVNDTLVAEAKAAGYAVYAGGSADMEFRLYFLKAPNAFSATVSGSGIFGRRAGIMHVKASGATSLDMDLPMTYDNPREFEDFLVGVDAPSDKCAGCSYHITLRIRAHDYKGPGTYDTAMIDFGAFSPGTKETYQYPASCQIAVTDGKTGTFNCKGLREQTTDAKADLSGTWTTPISG